ncbi:MAG: DoxX family protein [Opitutales bacterium]
MNPASLYHKLNNLLALLAGWLRSPFLLVIRLYWGWQFFLTGKGKLTHLDHTTDYFASLNIPAPRLNAMLAGSTECVFGLLLLAGLGGRVVPVPLIGLLITAYFTSEQEALHAFFSNPDKFLTADPFLFLFATVIILVFGPGKLSLDALFARKTSPDQ